jgi:hypothetical protein
MRGMRDRASAKVQLTEDVPMLLRKPTQRGSHQEAVHGRVAGIADWLFGDAVDFSLGAPARCAPLVDNDVSGHGIESGTVALPRAARRFGRRMRDCEPKRPYRRIQVGGTRGILGDRVESAPRMAVIPNERRWRD